MKKLFKCLFEIIFKKNVLLVELLPDFIENNLLLETVVVDFEQFLHFEVEIVEMKTVLFEKLIQFEDCEILGSFLREVDHDKFLEQLREHFLLELFLLSLDSYFFVIMMVLVF